MRCEVRGARCEVRGARCEVRGARCEVSESESESESESKYKLYFLLIEVLVFDDLSPGAAWLSIFSIRPTHLP